MGRSVKRLADVLMQRSKAHSSNEGRIVLGRVGLVSDTREDFLAGFWGREWRVVFAFGDDVITSKGEDGLVFFGYSVHGQRLRFCNTMAII